MLAHVLDLIGLFRARRAAQGLLQDGQRLGRLVEGQLQPLALGRVAVVRADHVRLVGDEAILHAAAEAVVDQDYERVALAAVAEREGDRLLVAEEVSVAEGRSDLRAAEPRGPRRVGEPAGHQSIARPGGNRADVVRTGRGEHPQHGQRLGPTARLGPPDQVGQQRRQVSVVGIDRADRAEELGTAQLGGKRADAAPQQGREPVENVGQHLLRCHPEQGLDAAHEFGAAAVSVIEHAQQVVRSPSGPQHLRHQFLELREVPATVQAIVRIG